jgi:hypothetical protein
MINIIIAPPSKATKTQPEKKKQLTDKERVLPVIPTKDEADKKIKEGRIIILSFLMLLIMARCLPMQR